MISEDHVMLKIQLRITEINYILKQNDIRNGIISQYYSETRYTIINMNWIEKRLRDINLQS